MMRETAWVTHWFERVLRYHKDHPDVDLVVSDRSPFSAVIYANKGRQLKECIATQIEELEAYTPVKVTNIMLDVEPSILWQRILARLEEEPERVRYNEAKEEWMWTVRARYDELRDVWDAVVDNSAPFGIHNIQASLLNLVHELKS